ncbi:MAG TPA: type III PLP-dependent enzyme [Mycobacteriales bacterium]|nr:type III PLP-dependent enzyme [Mycobacteriales bacterium]
MSGEFRIQGVSITELARKYGTPHFVYDGDLLRSQYGDLRRDLDPAMEMFFSLKANPNISICRLLSSLGARAEVSSLTELVTARRAGVDPQNIIFLGPGKSTAELIACLDEGIYAIVCESFEELRVLDGLARERGIRAPVALRVNPNFAVKGSRLTMGGKPRQFGIDQDQLMNSRDLIGEYPGLHIIGIHAYMGTRILDEDVVVENTTRIFTMAEEIAAALGIQLEVVDVGGGLGIAYFENESDLDPALLAAKLNPVIADFRQRHPGARLIMELGRYLTAPSGTYVVGVRYVKESMGERFAVADGGTNHHMAAVGVGSFVKRNFPLELLNRPAGDELMPWQITGPLCTPNDTIGKNVALPVLHAGDLLGVRRSGAYGPTASPVHFLSHGYPAEVLIDGGRDHLIRSADTVEDLLARQICFDALPTT